MQLMPMVSEITVNLYFTYLLKIPGTKLVRKTYPENEAWYDVS